MTRKQRKKLVGWELRKLRSKIFVLKVLIGNVLQDGFGRRLYATKPQDDLRLLILLQWHQKYKVSVSYILHAILPYWHQKFARHYGSSKGLGVKVSTLVGRVSERLLKQSIAKDFPDDEHLTEWQWMRRRRLLDARKETDAGEFSFIRVKGPLDYATLGKYVRGYRKRIESARNELDKAVASKTNQRRRYRGNPWL